jgi:hypothetical protein
VIEDEPVVVGVPEMRPVLGFRLSPVGRVPEVSVKVSGLCPPDAESGSENAALAVPVRPALGVAIAIGPTTVSAADAVAVLLVPLIALVTTTE